MHKTVCLATIGNGTTKSYTRMKAKSIFSLDFRTEPRNIHMFRLMT